MVSKPPNIRSFLPLLLLLSLLPHQGAKAFVDPSAGPGLVDVPSGLVDSPRWSGHSPGLLWTFLLALWALLGPLCTSQRAPDALWTFPGPQKTSQSFSGHSQWLCGLSWWPCGYSQQLCGPSRVLGSPVGSFVAPLLGFGDLRSGLVPPRGFMVDPPDVFVDLQVVLWAFPGSLFGLHAFLWTLLVCLWKLPGGFVDRLWSPVNLPGLLWTYWGLGRTSQRPCGTSQVLCADPTAFVDFNGGLVDPRSRFVQPLTIFYGPSPWLCGPSWWPCGPSQRPCASLRTF